MMMTPIGPHVPVLIDAIIERVSPVGGVWVDGTFGAGGYTRALLKAGANRVIGIDRDPEALALAKPLVSEYTDRLVLCAGRFSELDKIAMKAGAQSVSGVALDIGVSSMQVDRAKRGFSFRKTGPLDMRMEQTGKSAADVVNSATERELSDLLFQFGEERASRRIASAIVAERRKEPIVTTERLAEVICGVLPRARPGQLDPSTRSFQALRILINDELGELAKGLFAAERALGPGGWLAIVSFHSLEDRVVKRFFANASARASGGSRHAPPSSHEAPTFEIITRGAVVASEAEVAINPRARSAKLRIGRRTDQLARSFDPTGLGLPGLVLRGLET